MDVRELNENQIEELKNTYFYEVENDYDWSDEIPDEVIFDYFDGISFVNDDFFCTVNE